MTDMTPEEINDMLARWVGFEGSGLNNTFNDPPNSNPYHCHILPTPDYFGSNAAMDLLGVLVGKKYWYEMSSHADDTHTVAIGEWTGITSEDGNLMWFRKYICEAERKPTIPAAICTAIIELIERDGK